MVNSATKKCLVLAIVMCGLGASLCVADTTTHVTTTSDRTVFDRLGKDIIVPTV